MSASTRSSAPELILGLLLASAVPGACAETPAWCGVTDGPLPATIRAQLPPLSVRGTGDLRWFGLPVYDARLWSPPEAWRADRPFALEIRYARNIRGDQLAARSIDEMRLQGIGDESRHARWRAAMNRTFPDVREGDCLTGLAMPGAPTRFFVNGRLAGAIDDPEFGPAFFAIWLSPATSEPRLRRQLLGELR